MAGSPKLEVYLGHRVDFESSVSGRFKLVFMSILIYIILNSF